MQRTVSWLFNGAVISKDVVYEGMFVPGELRNISGYSLLTQNFLGITNELRVTCCSKYPLFKLKTRSDKCKRFSANSFDSVYYVQASEILKKQI
jgi:hypothetical protein